MELDQEKRCHSETTKVLRKKERHTKELMLASDEDRNNLHVLQEQIDKMQQKCNLYKRQLEEQVLIYTKESNEGDKIIAPRLNLIFSGNSCEFHIFKRYFYE